MPGGMDHDRTKLGPSLDGRIRGSNQEPTLNGSVPPHHPHFHTRASLALLLAGSKVRRGVII